MPDPVADRVHLGRITPGMDVCDVTGEKVGSISHIYRFDHADDGSAAPVPSVGEYIEVKTGFLGLGKHLWVPVSEVQEVLTDSIFLSRAEEAFEEAGFHIKPDYLDRVS